jgi:hypothetical protein
MPPEHARSFGGGAAATSLSPIVLVAMIIAIILTLVLPRKYALVPVLSMLFAVPLGQQIVVGGVHLFVSRIIILFGFSRVLLTRLTKQKSVLVGGFNSIDRAFFWCTLVQACAVVLLFQTTGALINQVGFLWDYLGGYFLLRFLLHDEEDVYSCLKCLAFLAVLFGAFMMVEQRTLHNYFGYIGGASIPDTRTGRVRSQGPFAHALMAGAFGSTLVPLFVLLWRSSKAKFVAAMGFLGAALMTYGSNASTSLLSFAAGMMAICLWPMRKSMRFIRWGIAGGVIALDLVMKAPVWFVIAHIDLTGGSSGYQRAALIDAFVRHFFDWWLIGVKDAGSWGWYLWDAQNQFVNVGETGGLLALILFIVMISRCFGRLGDARKAVQGDTQKEWFVWLLGATLFANVIAFFGVNYFDQMKFAWFMVLAMITTATAPALQAQAVSEPVPSVTLHTPAFDHPAPSVPSIPEPVATRSALGIFSPTKSRRLARPTQPVR